MTNDASTPAPPLADTLDQLAETVELRHQVYMTDEFGDVCEQCCTDAPCSELKLTLAARAAASELRRLAAVETAAMVVLSWHDHDANPYLSHEPTPRTRERQWDALRTALATAAQPTAEGR